MSEELGYISSAMKNGICWVQLYSDKIIHDDLFNALHFFGFYPVGFDFDFRQIRGVEKPVLDKTPFKGSAMDVWMVDGSIRKDSERAVLNPE